ncbi:MAG: EAL domain-containing protein [Candidatus Brocadiales bacterium]
MLVFTLCISLIPIAIITSLSYFYTRSTIKKETLEWMTSVAASRKISAVSFVDAKRARTVDFSSDGFIRDSLEEIEWGGVREQRAVRVLNKHLLLNKMPLDPYIVAIEVADREGVVVASTSEAMIGRDISNEDIFTQATDSVYYRPYISRPYLSPFLHVNEIGISVPITSRRGVETIGLIINHYDMTFLNEIVADRTGMGKTGEVVLGERDGASIVFLTSLRFVPDAPLSLRVPWDSTGSEAMRLALEGENGAIIASDYRDVEAVAAYQYIRSLDWVLVAKIDATEAFAPLNMLSIAALIVGLVSAAVVASFAIVFAISTSRPIKKLTNATERFTKGDLKTRVEVTRKDEIGDLAKSFNAMAMELEREITERERRELELRKLSLVVEQSNNMVMITDVNGNIEYVNPRFTQVTGYTSEEVIGRNPRILKSGKVSQKEYKRLWETITAGKEWRGEFCNKKKSGELYWESAFITPIVDQENTITHFVAIREDITERRKTEETIQRMAYYDSVTGLPNRMLFNDRLTLAVAHARRNKEMLAVLFLDLDRFKVVNDTLGHSMGDKLLRGVARRLKSCVREGDTVARLGGDEFTLLLPKIKRVENMAKIAGKVLTAIKEPLRLDGHELHITTSIGIAIYPGDGSDAETLLKNADAAMYHAKEQGRDNYQFYTPSFHARASRQMELEGSMYGALEREEFELNYQPVVDINTGRIVGVEALLRWHHPEQGLVPPNEFISVAENTGLITQIGEWVLHTACAQNKAWQDAGLPPIHVSVNLSSRQFQQINLIEIIDRVLRETGLDARFLELEITEGSAMQNVESTIYKLKGMDALGVKIAIDDFGVGYSSLSYLKRFPIHTLKIDRSFVSDITTDPDDRAIVTAIIALAKTMNLKVVAEGVETGEQLDFLRRLHCDEMQGYLFSKPVPAGELREMLAQDKRL